MYLSIWKSSLTRYILRCKLLYSLQVDGREVPGPLFDFGLLMFHCARRLMKAESGPFFYLSKVEGANEARLWNEVFCWAQDQLSIPRGESGGRINAYYLSLSLSLSFSFIYFIYLISPLIVSQINNNDHDIIAISHHTFSITIAHLHILTGTIKSCVLIENILASFEMEAILYELRHHSIGLNCGIWDYSASFVNKFGEGKGRERIFTLCLLCCNYYEVTFFFYLTFISFLTLYSLSCCLRLILLYFLSFQTHQRARIHFFRLISTSLSPSPYTHILLHSYSLHLSFPILSILFITFLSLLHLLLYPLWSSSPPLFPSILHRLGHRQDFMLPDRNKYVNMQRHFLRSYMDLVIHTCHKRGAHATGGMAATILGTKYVEWVVVEVVVWRLSEGCV